MARQRYLNTKFWDDTYIVELQPLEKYLYIYFLTNPLTTIYGVYEISIRRMELDTGLKKYEIRRIIDKLQKDEKVCYSNGTLGIRNFIKHQKVNTNIKKGIDKGLEDIDENIKKFVLNQEYKAFQSLSNPLNYVNVNVNSNVNVNDNSNINTNINNVKKKPNGFTCKFKELGRHKKMFCDKMHLYNFCPKSEEFCQEQYNGLTTKLINWAKKDRVEGADGETWQFKRSANYSRLYNKFLDDLNRDKFLDILKSYEPKQNQVNINKLMELIKST
jgi:hypothetical protein